MPDFEFRPVDRTRWPDLEKLFESRGGPHNCWCVLWRKVPSKLKEQGKTGKKKVLKAQVDEGLPIGLLAYDQHEPVAWCSVAPRETYRTLGGDETLERVWSLVCFFISREYRQSGLTKQLILASIEHAKKHGAQYLEAFPVAPDSPSYKFMGLVPVFEELGFEVIKKVGSRRNLAMLDLR
ncbi:MAG: GNAT family N-acetyltransferase [Bacteroidota bacterium]